ncbi:PQQ-binding-like beta-propeller repeat protein [Euryarchaeota archaeon]|nr:PQQ-binding-like beta-propeller repeat protein [Euryarchaeota archaeon]
MYFYDRDNSSNNWNYYHQTHRITDVSISDNGEYIFVSFSDQGSHFVSLFHKDDDEPLWSYTMGSQQYASISEVDISSDGKYMVAVAGTTDGIVVLEKGSNDQVWESSDSRDTVDMSADGKYFVTGKRASNPNGGDHGRLHLYKTTSSTALWSYTPSGNIYDVAISSDGEHIAVCSGWSGDDYYVKLFDKDSNSEVWSHTIEGSCQLSISEDGRYIVAGEDEGDSFTYFFETSSSSPIWSFEGDSEDISNSKISADGHWISIGTIDNDEDGVAENHLYSFKTSLVSRPSAIPYSPSLGNETDGSPILKWFYGSNDISNLTFDVHLDTNSNPSTKIASNLTDSQFIPSNLAMNTTYYWKVVAKDSSGTTVSKIMNFIVEVAPIWVYDTGVDDDLHSTATSADGEYIAAGGFDNKVYLFRKDSNSSIWSYNTGSAIRSVAISADGEYIVAGGYDDKIHLFDKDDSSPEWSYETGDHVYVVAISSDGEYIAAGSRDDKVYFFKRGSSTPLWSHDVGDHVTAISISADGEYIAAGSSNDRLYLFDKDSSTPLWNYHVGTNVESVSISADGDYIVVGSHNAAGNSDEIYLLHKDSNSPVWDYTSNDGHWESVDISANGEYIVGGSSDDKVYLFNKGSSTPLWSYDTDASIRTVSISASGEYIFAASQNKKIFLFDKDSSTPLWNYTGNSYPVDDQASSISADGKYITIGTDGGKVVTFKNSLADRPSIIPYGPHSGSEVESPVLRWFAGSDDRANLTFDVYLGTSTSSLTKVAEDITALRYSPGNLATGQKYYWKVVATDPSGSKTSSIMNFTFTGAMWISNLGTYVYDVAVSSDGEYFVAGTDTGDDDEGKVYLFKYGNSTPLWTYETEYSVNSVAISADGEYIVAVTAGGGSKPKLFLFDKDSSTPVWKTSAPGSISCVDISSDGEYIAVASYSSAVHLYSRNSSSSLWEYNLDDDSKDATSVSLSADGEYLVVGTEDNEILLFDKDSSTPLLDYSVDGDVDTVSMSASGEYFVAGSADDDIYFFKRGESSPSWTYSTGDDVGSVSISADGNYITAGSNDNKVYLFAKESSTPEWSYSLGQDVTSVSISADSKFVFAGDYYGSQVLLDATTGSKLWSYKDSNSTTSGTKTVTTSISADGKYLFSGSRMYKVYAFENINVSRPSLIPYGPRNGAEVSSPQLIWFAGSDDRANLTFDVYLGTSSSSLTKVADDITTLNYSPSNLAMNNTYYWKVVATDSSGSITSSVMNFTVEVAPEWSYDTDKAVRSAVVSADGEYIVGGSYDGYVYLFEKDNDSPLWSYDLGSDQVKIAISSDGEYIVTGCECLDGIIHLFDKDSNTPLWSYETYDSVGTKPVAISSDGKYILAASGNKLFFFEKSSNTPLWTYNKGGDPFYSVSLSADGQHIVAGTIDDNGPEIYLFSKDSNTPKWTSSLDNDIFSSVEISADGKYIVAGTYADKIYFFNRESSTPVWNYDTGANVRQVSITSNGDYIVAGSSNNKLYLFGKDNNTPLWTYSANDDIYSAQISENGKYIIAGSYDDNIYFFDISSSEPLWSFEAPGNVLSVSLSADGKYSTAGTWVGSNTNDGKIYTFKNALVERPVLFTYGPYSGSNTSTNPQLGWFAGSDDRANLTFDVYLSTSSNPTTKVADDITTFYYNAQCLSLNTKYYWKVVATDGDDTVTSSIMNFTVTSYGNIYCVSIDDNYDPDTLTIKKGSTVIWTNDDNSLHTVTEDDDGFDSGSISPGNTWSYTFNTVGTYDYYDQYDDDLDGQIIVLTSYQPTASIDSISPQIAELDGSVSFSGSGSDSDGTISEYKWTSSIDGSLSTSASFSTADLSFGNHTITFRVKDNDGVWSDNVTSWVDVRKSPEWIYETELSIYEIDISADGEYIAAVDGGGSGNVYLFGKNISNPIWTYESDTAMFRTVSISANGDYIVAGCYDDKVYLFHKNSSTPVWSYSLDDIVFSVDISADGEYIVAGSQDNTIYFFHKDSSTPLWTKATEGDTFSIAISADGNYLVSGSHAPDDNIRLFGKNNNTPIWEYNIGSSVKKVSISADGEYIVVGDMGGTTRLFHKGSNSPLWTYEGEGIHTVALSAKGELIVVGSTDNKVHLFNRYSSTPIWSYTTEGNVNSVSISSDGKYILAGSGVDDNSDLGHAHFFRKESSTPLWESSFEQSGYSTALSADGKYVIACANDDLNVFVQDSIQRPSILPYGPRSGTETLLNTTLSWFPGSDDITNLTFDVYLGWVKNDVLNNNSAALVADDITNYTHYATSLTEGKKYYWKVVATDPSGSVTSKLMNFTVLDTTAPVANITGGPSNPSDSRNATFNFTANENDVTFQCKIDTGDWYSCSSPKTYTNLSDDSTHQFQVKATDSSNNTGSAATWIWQISDLTAPIASISSGPDNITNSQSATFAFSSNDDDATFECKLDTGSWSSCSSPKSYSSLSEGEHTFYTRATDDDDNTGDEASYNWEIDITNPITVISSGPSSPTNSQSATFTFTSNEDDSTFECKLDASSWSSCSSSTSYSDLSEGTHSFVVKATDEAGNTGSPDYHNWTIDLTDPIATISTGPDSLTNSQSATFTFTSNEDGSTFECKLDTSSWSSCSSSISYSDLSEGTHSFAVKATDEAGNTGGSDYHNWTIDITDPVTTISSGPDSLTNVQSATFAFSSNEDDSTFECKMDSGSWSNCTSPISYSNLAEGSHSFQVKATDEADNTGSPDYHNWTIDITDPIITISSSIGDLTNNQTAVFTLSSNEDNSTFECKLDYSGWADCDSPKTYVGLSEGLHMFYARATDEADNTGSSKSHTWTIDITDPITTINSKPANQTNSQNATFTFSSNEQGSSFECKLDEGSWNNCSSPTNYYNLSEDTHCFKVRATDESGNTGEEAIYNWTVDLSGSSAYISSGPNNPTNSVNATFYIGSYESTDTLQCNLGSAGWSDCTSPKTYYDLSEGNHSFSLRAIDSVGNIGPLVYYNWTTDYTDPIVVITSTPVSLTNLSSATFEFVSNENNSTFECKLGNNSSWSSCNTPIIYNNLNESTHTFYVRSTDEAGNLGNTATYSWLTDYTDPTVTFTEYPSERTNKEIITFNFTVDETASFECSFDSSDWYECNYPVSFNNLSEATYLFKVRATDNANNTGSSADYYWTIDRTNPITTIDSGPTYDNGTYYTSNIAIFSFSNNENEYNHTDECSIDETSWSFCTSSVIYNNLSEGNHTFRVRTTDEAGNLGDAVQWNWTIDTTKPTSVITFVNPQIAFFNVTEVSFIGIGFDQTGYIVDYEWFSSLDGYLSNLSAFSINNLSGGNHTITFRVLDNSNLWSEYNSSWVDVRDGTPVANIMDFNYTVVNHNSLLYFEGIGEDVDGIITDYRWESSIDGIISQESLFTTNILSSGIHNIYFFVKDNDNQWSLSDNVTFRINAYPEIFNVQWNNPSAYRDEPSLLLGNVNDMEGNTEEFIFKLDYRNFFEDNVWYEANSSFVINNDIFELIFTPNSTFKSIPYDFRIIVTDTDNATTTFFFNQSLQIQNRDPVIFEIFPSDYLVNEGLYLYLYGNYTDDVEIIQHEWISDLQGSFGNEETVAINSLQPGIHQITYRVIDNEGAFAEMSVEIRINGLPIVNDILLNKDILISNDTLHAEYFASDDLGIVDHKWYLDDLPIESFVSTNSNYNYYYIHDVDNFEESGVVTVEAQYEDYVGFRTNREMVPVGTFTSLDARNDMGMYTSSIFILESINLTWEDIEGSDDSCEWTFIVFQGGSLITEVKQDCGHNGDGLVGSIYELGVELNTAQYGPDFSIEIWYEGWDDIEISFGDELSNIVISNSLPLSQDYIFTLDDDNFIIEANLDGDIIHAIANYDGDGLGISGTDRTRTKGDFAYIGKWGGQPLQSEGEYIIQKFTVGWIAADNQYDTKCEWKLKILRNGFEIGESIHQCLDISSNFVNETYDIYINHYISQGDIIEYELWFKSFEHLDIYADFSSIEIACESCYGLSDLDNFEFRMEMFDNRLDLTNLPLGEHELSLKVKDTDGIWSEVFRKGFLVNEPPTAIIDSVVSNIFFQEDPRYVTVDVFGRGFDDVGVDSCEWKFEYLDNELFNFNIDTQKFSTSLPCKLIGIDNLTTGNYTISLRVVDTLGVWGDWFIYPEFYVDDGDNQGYAYDKYPLDNTQWVDTDNDGCGDNQAGNNGDAFPEDPTECLDSDGDGIGDNSDFLPNIPNMYAYAGSGVSIALLGAALAELGARRSIPGLINQLQELSSSGITNDKIGDLISNLEDGGGSSFLSGDRSEALSLLQEYEGITSGATQSMTELDELMSQLEEMEASGISSPDIQAELNEIEEMLSSQVAEDTNSDFLETLQEKVKDNK